MEERARAYNDFICDVWVKIMCRVLEEPTLDLPDGLALHHQGELDGGHVRVVLDFVVLIQKKMGDMFAFNYFDIFVIHS